MPAESPEPTPGHDSDPDPPAGDDQPPAFSPGRYQFVGPPATTRPPDPVIPFIAPPVSRRPRSDWPVLVVALVVAAIVLAACCIAGYALFAARGAPTF